MASQQSRKRKSVVVDEERDSPEEATTRPGTPTRKRIKISQSQKQALIDNLQLEITERARHLRAHYALQATDLRSRIERRVNRIPISLRKVTMGELLAKYAEAPVVKEMPQAFNSTKAIPEVPVAESSHPFPPIPKPTPSSPVKHIRLANTPTKKGIKRRSSEIVILSDKENEPTVQPDRLSNPKNPKRTATATTGAARAASRTAKANPSNVLSPKSHNSRTLPCSPIKDHNPPPHSPSKPSYIARPTSPLKPASPLKTAANAATSAISASLHGMVQHAKRGAGTAAAGLRRTESKEKAAANAKSKIMPPPARPAAAQQQQERPASQVSNHSAASHSSMTSSATTVVTKKTVRKGKTAPSASTATQKATEATATKASAVKGAGGKATGVAAKKVIVAEPATGKRVLRKRN